LWPGIARARFGSACEVQARGPSLTRDPSPGRRPAEPVEGVEVLASPLRSRSACTLESDGYPISKQLVHPNTLVPLSCSKPAARCCSACCSAVWALHAPLSWALYMLLQFLNFPGIQYQLQYKMASNIWHVRDGCSETSQLCIYLPNFHNTRHYFLDTKNHKLASKRLHWSTCSAADVSSPGHIWSLMASKLLFQQTNKNKNNSFRAALQYFDEVTYPNAELHECPLLWNWSILSVVFHQNAECLSGRGCAIRYNWYINCWEILLIESNFHLESDQ